MTPQRGLAAVIMAYVAWGLLPIYWKLLGQVPALEILAHRILWSFVLALILYTSSVSHRYPLRLLFKRKTLLSLVGTSVLIACNWLLYVWSVNNDHVIDSSLGYFITPLLAVLLGVTVLKEKMRAMQWLSVALAAIGVLYMTLALGQFPWIALGLAMSFGIYTLLRKVSQAPALEALMMEMGILSVPSLLVIILLHTHSDAQFLSSSSTTVLLMGTGLATLAPLLLFINGARQISLATAGLVQYLSPTLNFFLGVFLYKEHFPVAQQRGFYFIWLALLLFTFDQFRRSMQNNRQALH
ncbi:MAG: EamA family transporter RarD [Desulfobulbaceae bacterium]|nr:EamA family transporter RarD [Desulfobulbaceae bacterium]